MLLWDNYNCYHGITIVTTIIATMITTIIATMIITMIAAMIIAIIAIIRWLWLLMKLMKARRINSNSKRTLD